MDGQGNSYITGRTDQRPDNFPVTPGAFQTTAGIDKAPSGGVAGDAFVLKVDPAGAVIYGTFLGGSGIDEGLGIAVDGHGNAAVAGTTSGTVNGLSDFPVTDNAVQTRPSNLWSPGFLSELSADGTTLLYSTFLSGSNGERPGAVAANGRGNVYVAGSTNSPDFPTTPNAYSRSCGGNGACTPIEPCYFDWSSGQNECHIYNPEDAFVAEIDPTRSGAASLVYSTFLGGLNRDIGTAIAVDADGAAYVAGRTASSDFPVRQASQPAFGGAWNSFAAKLDPTKGGDASLVWSTYLGGSGYDEADGLALDTGRNVYLTGFTTSKDFPTQNPAQGSNNGTSDAFVTKLSPAAPATLAALTLDHPSMTGGGSATGTVSLSGPAPAGGATVALTRSAPPAASVPAAVTVPAGATSATFAVVVQAVSAPTSVTLSANYNGARASAALSLVPPAPATPTNTVAPPTATPTNTVTPPSATATNTSAPPAATATNTPAPPLATATATPPSNAPGRGATPPPAATATSPAPPVAASVTPTSAPSKADAGPSPAAGASTPPAARSGSGGTAATPAPWKPNHPRPRRDALPLSLSLGHATLQGGGTLTLVVTTAASARVSACLATTTTRVTWTVTGRRRARHVLHVQVCRVMQQGQADQHGRFALRLHVVEAWHTVVLSVHVQAGSRAATRSIPVSIQPDRRGVSRRRSPR